MIAAGTRTTFFETPAGQVAAQRIIERGVQYWQANVYRYYRAHSGRLGKSCTIRLAGGQFLVSMKPLINVETGTEYGRSIRQGISAGPGEYDPELGVRRKTGYFPGVSVSKFWLPWMRDFQTAFKRIVGEEMKVATPQVVSQMIRRQR